MRYIGKEAHIHIIYLLFLLLFLLSLLLGNFLGLNLLAQLYDEISYPEKTYEILKYSPPRQPHRSGNADLDGILCHHYRLITVCDPHLEIIFPSRDI